MALEAAKRAESHHGATGARERDSSGTTEDARSAAKVMERIARREAHEVRRSGSPKAFLSAFIMS